MPRRIAALIDDAKAAGVRLEAPGGSLLVRGPRKAEALVDELTKRKPVVIQVARGWDYETAELIAWFEATSPPPEPFQLKPGIWIARPDYWWAYLHADIRSGPNAARGQTGAFQADLRRLYEIWKAMPWAE